MRRTHLNKELGLTRTIIASRPGRLIAVALVAALAVAGILWAANAADRGTESETLPPVQLSLGESPGLASCLAFDIAILADMEVAFEGTSTAVSGEIVTLSVDRWFRGGDADTVQLTAPLGLEALIGGIDFRPGTQYLITAADGVVNYCGYSGESTAELRTAFETAFTG